MKICLTGFSKDEKNELKAKIEFLGGAFSADLSHSVKVLVADKVGTEKYFAAIERKISVVNKKWIFASVEKEVFCPLKCFEANVFQGLVFASTGLKKDEKLLVKTLIDELGGSYLANFDATVTHLLTRERKGGKQNLASMFSCKVLDPSFVIDCSAQNKLLREEKYLVNVIIEKEKLEIQRSTSKKPKFEAKVSAILPSVTAFIKKMIKEGSSYGSRDIFTGMIFHFHGFDKKSLDYAKVASGCGALSCTGWTTSLSKLY
eukprot:snap_masked-scaffold_4-processed-gene-15.8-mRNA-1 protein AED:1.00 eAED:1.00 QI:0/0/0/0/1/1/10/0/259